MWDLGVNTKINSLLLSWHCIVKYLNSKQTRTGVEPVLALPNGKSNHTILWTSL